MQFESPNLRISLNKLDFGRWSNQLSSVRDNDQILSVSQTKGDNVYCPNGHELHSWDYLEGKNTLDFPSATYDLVYLWKVLEHRDWDAQKALVRESLRVVKPGGKVFALSVACNDQEEVFLFLQKHGFDTKQFEQTRLSNRCIAQLGPHGAAFFQSHIIIPNRKRFVSYLAEQGFTATLEQMWHVRDNFGINRLHVGLCWVRDV
jgi:SAM-dependent methyltransferase